MRSQIVVIENAFKCSAGKHELIWTRNVIGLFLTCNAGGSVCYNRTARAVCWGTLLRQRARKQPGTSVPWRSSRCRLRLRSAPSAPTTRRWRASRWHRSCFGPRCRRFGRSNWHRNRFCSGSRFRWSGCWRRHTTRSRRARRAGRSK